MTSLPARIQLYPQVFKPSLWLVMKYQCQVLFLDQMHYSKNEIVDLHKFIILSSKRQAFVVKNVKRHWPNVNLLKHNLPHEVCMQILDLILTDQNGTW